MATVNAIILNSAGEIAMIIKPDYDSQLDDPAFNPLNHTHIRIPVEHYNNCKNHSEILDVVYSIHPELKK